MKILVVDDEHDVQLLFEQRFRKEIRNHEMNFVFAFSGEEALTYLNSHEHEVVLILSDINMPGMSGLELLDHIKHGVAIGIEDADERADGNIALQMREQLLVTPNCCMAA